MNKIAKINLEIVKPIMKKNEKVNIKNNYNTVGKFLGNFKLENKPIVIASSGPSLEKDLSIIKESRECIKIFPVGRFLEIPLFFISTVSRWAVEAYKGPEYMFFNKECSFNKGNIMA